MPLPGLSIIVMTVLYTSHENKVSYSAPVPVEIPRFTGANQAFLPPSSFTLNFTGADCGLLPPSFFIDVDPNCGKSQLCSGCFAIRRGLCRNNTCNQ